MKWTEVVKGGRRREQGWFRVGSEGDRAGSARYPGGRRQGHEAVTVYRQHGRLGHHVLEVAVGLDPAHALAELFDNPVRVGRGRAAISVHKTTISSAAKERPVNPGRLKGRHEAGYRCIKAPTFNFIVSARFSLFAAVVDDSWRARLTRPVFSSSTTSRPLPFREPPM